MCADSLDDTLLRTWEEDDRLLRDVKKIGRRGVQAPQLLIDGVPIQRYEDLLVMEEENDLGEGQQRDASSISWTT